MVAGTLTPAPRTASWPTAVAWLFAASYAGAGMVAMWLLAPRVPYADGWRHLGRYLALPFPRDVLAPDNGHLELSANLVRVIELRWFDAAQWLQVVAGMLLAAATVVMAWLTLRRHLESAARAAGMLAVVLGVFWLGNYRALVHGNESVHAYAVTLSLFTGLWCLVRRTRMPGDMRAEVHAGLLASACGLAAAFSFGSGIACFAAFGTVLLLQRSPRGFAVLVGGFVLTLVLARSAGGAATAPEWSWWQQCVQLVRWLAAPPVHAAGIVLDPGVAAQVPLAALRTPLGTVARGAETAFGPVVLAHWPHLLLGAAGLGWCAWLTFRAWRPATTATDEAARAGVLTGIGLCAFAVGSGLLVVLMRLSYFEQHPDQVLATRYLVWSSLFWAGLLLATVAQAGRATRACVAAVAVAILLLPSQAWFARSASAIRPLAEQAALAGAAGVLEPGLPLGETVAGELMAALPLAREARTAVFAWPEARALGRRVEVDAPSALEGGVDVHVVDNLLGGQARRVRFQKANVGCTRMLLVDADGVARGLAMPDPAGDGRWLGWMRGTAVSPPTVAGCSAARMSARR